MLLMAADAAAAARLPLGTCDESCCADQTVGLAAPAGRSERRSVLTRRVRLLVAATITYNVVEAIVAIAAGHGRAARPR